MIRKPEMTKNTSTPTNPPGSACGQKWQTTTTATAIARSAWISGRITLPRARGGAAGRSSARVAVTFDSDYWRVRRPGHRDPADSVTLPRVKAIVGLDVGTTATKAVAFQVGSTEREVVLREYPLHQPAPGQEVQDPDVMVDAVLDALSELSADAVSLGTAMHGLIGLDAEMAPVTPLLTWADGRAVAQARALRDRAAELLARTGTPVHPMSPLVKIRWFHECEPETAARVRWWVGLKDYLVYRLTGELVTEFSSASAAGLLDLATLEWDEEAVSLAGTTIDHLPPVRSPWDVLRASASCPSCWAPRTGRSATWARALWPAAWPASRWARAAPCGWSSPPRGPIPAARCSVTR